MRRFPQLAKTFADPGNGLKADVPIARPAFPECHLPDVPATELIFRLPR